MKWPQRDGAVVEVGGPGPPQRGGVVAERGAPVLLEHGDRHGRRAAGLPGRPDRARRRCPRRRGSRRRSTAPARGRRRRYSARTSGRDRVRVGAPSRRGSGRRTRPRVAAIIRSGRPARLGHQVQVQGDGGVDAVQDVPHVEGRQHVQRGQVGDRVGVVEAGPDRHEGTAVVARPAANRSMPSARGDGDDVRGHGALGVGVRPRSPPACRCRRSRAGRGRSRCGRRRGPRRRAATSGGSAGSRAAARSAGRHPRSRPAARLRPRRGRCGR